MDLTFELRGQTIPRHHSDLLFRALARELAWLEQEEGAGIHAIAGPDAGAERIYVTRRTRLVLRLPRERAQQAQLLAGARLDVGGELSVGEARIRPLVPHDTLYARLVAAACDSEPAFEDEMAQQLNDAGVRCAIICGQRGEVNANGATMRGQSVLLHGLTQDDSLRMQEMGLGVGRKFGCGLFTPHKSVRAVGT
ncbi:MAG TPA: type I-MYXAN CRISPR-associated protein Cas6/Cmx6 [Burkholderiales bacterium]|nr:type I-MYXAN CRISPR-associated protein Cas6/Cmx6 [Burkholderiales bacterium]